MKAASLSRHPALSQVAERQMRTWALKLQTQQRIADVRPTDSVTQLIKPYLFISREAGANGSELAHTIGRKTGWQVLDGELLDYLAEHEHVSRLALEEVDEKSASWFHEIFGKWLDKQLVTQAKYVSRLGKVILLAAQHERSVFVGRGAQFMLPREAGMAVRIIAPRKNRIECLMRQRQCSRSDAEQFMDETDRGRSDFVQRYFQHDVADPHLYDLVINLARIPLEDAAEVLVAQMRRRFPS